MLSSSVGEKCSGFRHAPASQVFVESHKSVTEHTVEKIISGSIWDKSFIQTLKYCIFEDKVSEIRRLPVHKF